MSHTRCAIPSPQPIVSRADSDSPDYLLLCLRIPKSGSLSLKNGLAAAGHGRRIFYLPNTLDLDGRLSRLQRVRFRRSQICNLLRHYGSPSLRRALGHIENYGRRGDFVSGGHIDFRSVQNRMNREIKIITILRNPYDRCRSEYYYGRRNYLARPFLSRLDSSQIPRAAGKYNFAGFLDFLLDSKHVYGDIAATYLGLAPWAHVGAFFRSHVYHAGTLDSPMSFARTLSEKLGSRFDLPHLNASGSADNIPLDSAAKRKIEALCPRDFAIYEYLLAQLPAKHRQQLAQV